ncbi:hypothetical protein BJ994_002138 [Arthrobacter pigmenti]|uniref:Uncharacterized protein n=1 Tax=Arthrobacter pigmenti TaxID=271432 RepID=A0A846RR62_9MICC|nr:hypothetical protein [Arthrobacter pigmenti]NJC23062.1 hypothetical protein [Arthrobacter pigmenti]
MTALTGFSSPARPEGFDALLIVVGRWLVSAGEQLAAGHSTAARHTTYEEHSRDVAATRHSGLWL